LPARRAVAAAALALLGQGAGEEFTEEVLGAMEGLGSEAVPALVSFAADDLLSRPLRRRAIERAARIADAERRAAGRRAGAAAVRRGALEARRLALSRGFSLADAALALAGRLAAHPASPAPLRRRILRDLAGRLAGPPGPDLAGAAEGFRDYVGRGGPLSARERDETVRDLLRLLEETGAGGGAAGTEVATRRGGDLAEGPGAAIHVRAVPAALDALRTLAERPGGPAAPVARALLATWRRLAGGGIVLAPGARIRVAETLARLSRHARQGGRRLRAEATAALLSEWRRTREVPLVPILAGLLAEPPALPEAAPAAASFLRELLGDAGDAASGEDERRVAVEAAARVLAAGAVARGEAAGLLPALVRIASLPGAVGPGPECEALAALAAARGIPREVRDALRRLTGQVRP
ncbi:MAG: hypothetical protein L0216_03260, partial [Planctomycetales bacterium]|nr:hypothetical protein [Planctomycetales bacterium]